MSNDQTTDPTDRDRKLAAYWTERGDLRAWIAGIIAATRRAEREECLQRAYDAMEPRNL
jgi:hypothetical protein